MANTVVIRSARPGAADPLGPGRRRALETFAHDSNTVETMIARAERVLPSDGR